jgi:hypothetical protein
MLSFITLLLALVTNPPWIYTSDKGVTFDVKFEPSSFGCVVFRMTEPTEAVSEVWPDGHYAPRSCFNAEPPVTSYVALWSRYVPLYNVDWDVYAEIHYNNAAGETFILESNRIRVHR